MITNESQIQKIIWAQLVPELDAERVSKLGRDFGDALVELEGVDYARVGVPRQLCAGEPRSMIAVIRFADDRARRECERGAEFRRWTELELERHAVEVRVWEFPVA